MALLASLAAASAPLPALAAPIAIVAAVNIIVPVRCPHLPE